MVVLPQPGGPQRIIEERRRAAIMRPIGASGARRWSCPTTSSRACGRKPVGERTRRPLLEQPGPAVRRTAPLSSHAHAKSCPARRMPKVHGPAHVAERAAELCDGQSTGWRLRLTMMSPCCSPSLDGERVAVNLGDDDAPRRRERAPNSSACAGLRLATVAPASGSLRRSAVVCARRVSGGAASATSTLCVLAVAPEVSEHAGAADRQGRDAEAQVLRIGDLMAVDRGDHVADCNAGLGAGCSEATSLTSDAARTRQARLLAISAVTSWPLRAEPGTTMAAAHRRLQQQCAPAPRNGKADADRAARLREDRRVDADELAVEIDQRAARVAGIDRRIGLDEGSRRRDRCRCGPAPRRCRWSPSARRRRDRRSRARGRRPRAGRCRQTSRIGRRLATGIDLQHGEIGMLVSDQQLRRRNSRRSVSTHGDLFRGRLITW